MSQSTYTNKVSYFFSLFKQSLRGGEYDYTTGSIRAAILLLAVPMILELSLESVFALVDIFFVSKLGSNAVQTVGLTESVITLVYSLAIGLSTAATAMVARRIGEKNPEAAAHVADCNGVYQCSGNYFRPGYTPHHGCHTCCDKRGSSFYPYYARGQCCHYFTISYQWYFSWCRQCRYCDAEFMDSQYYQYNIMSCFINGWGPLPELGLKGAAIATVIGRGTGVLYQCYFLFKGKKGSISLGKEHFIIDFPLMKSLVKIAWPATFQFIIASGSWIVLAHLVAVTGGTHASAGYQIAIRNMVFFILPAWGLSNAAATLVGQNLGAKQPDRAEKSVLLTTKYNAIFMSGVMLLFIFFARPIISFFTTIPEDLKFYGIGMVMVQALNGAGDTKTPTWINFFGFWLFQIPLAYLLVKVFKLGVVGAFIAIPVAESALAIAAWYYFKKGKWKKVKV